MGIDRPRNAPHKGFHRKEKSVSTAGRSTKSDAGRRADDVRIPPNGPIKLFFDDEREMPEGFVIARRIPDLQRMLDQMDLSRLHTVCLDWHLKADMRTHAEESGHDAVAMLVRMIDADPERFSGLSSIWMHSTDREKAADMARIMQRCLDSHGDLFEDVYVLVETYSPKVGV